MGGEGVDVQLKKNCRSRMGEGGGRPIEKKLAASEMIKASAKRQEELVS